MTQRALIDPRGIIVQVEPIGSDFPVAPPFKWVDCPDGCEPYVWTWDGANCNAPPGPTAAQLRQPLVNAAAQQLAATEKIAIRYFMAGLPFPPAWQAHAVALRAIRDGVDLSSSALPPDPPTIAGI